MKAWLVTGAVIALIGCTQNGGGNTATNAAVNTAASTPSEVRADAGSGMAPPAASAQAQASAENPLPEGFYRLQDTEGDLDGAVAAFCYARGQGTEMVGERVAYTSDPYPCGPISRRLTADGFTQTQECNLNQGHTRYTVTARHEDNGDYSVRVVALLDDGSQPPNDHPRSQRLRRIGECPEGWRPGDFLSLTYGRGDDGVYRAHRILHNDDVGPTFDELPAYLTALLPH